MAFVEVRIGIADGVLGPDDVVPEQRTLGLQPPSQDGELCGHRGTPYCCMPSCLDRAILVVRAAGHEEFGDGQADVTLLYAYVLSALREWPNSMKLLSSRSCGG